jgi:hypothetical protein
VTVAIYTIQAFKGGQRTLQSKLIGATTDRSLAIAVAENEEVRRDHKWKCEVLEFTSPAEPPRVVRPLL